jgi:hypothetical protein
LANGTIGRLDVVAVQELVAYAAYDERNLDQLDPETRLRLRAATYAFIGALPPPKAIFRRGSRQRGPG